MLAFIILFLFQGTLAQIPGKQCGGVVCLDNSDVTCISGNNTCQCKDGMVGNGRFGCVDAATSCICYLYGDPYVTAFSQSVMSAPLPCHHVLTEFTTPDGIYVKITATASSRNDRPYPSFVFEDGLSFIATKGDTMARALFRRDGFWNKGLKLKLPVRSNFPDFGLYCWADPAQYWTLEIPRFGVVVRYRSADSSVTIEAPKNSQYVRNTLCGDCGDPKTTYRTMAQAAGMTLSEWSLVGTVLNLDAENDENPQCKNLDRVFKSCGDDKTAEALKFCGAPFSHNDIGECFVQAYGRGEILSMMNGCIEAFCGSGVTDSWCRKTNTAKTQCTKQADFSVILNKC
ncbi:hypothetical protein SNE40_008784 [Patella caerulea]|uniref:VWFD domain-containing protein n=1 Tax=Patella caerulea TaxID=87958 RepID=A0AAN8JT89_PATCE